MYRPSIIGQSYIVNSIYVNNIFWSVPVLVSDSKKIVAQYKKICPIRNINTESEDRRIVFFYSKVPNCNFD